MDVGNLKERRTRIANELSKLDALIAAIDAYASEFGLDALDSTPKPKADPPSRSRTSAKPAEPTLTELTADAAEAAISEANAPLSLARLEDAVRQAGVSLPSGDSARNVLGARLYNSQRFDADRATGYWIKGRPKPDELDITSEGVNENEASVADAADASETALDAQDGRPQE